jgi:hypothetical protein
MFAKVEIVTRETKDAFVGQPLHHVVNYRKNDYDKTKAMGAQPVQLGPVELRL